MPLSVDWDCPPFAPLCSTSPRMWKRKENKGLFNVECKRIINYKHIILILKKSRAEKPIAIEKRPASDSLRDGGGGGLEAEERARSQILMERIGCSHKKI